MIQYRNQDIEPIVTLILDHYNRSNIIYSDPDVKASDIYKEYRNAAILAAMDITDISMSI